MPGAASFSNTTLNPVTLMTFGAKYAILAQITFTIFLLNALNFNIILIYYSLVIINLDVHR